MSCVGFILDLQWNLLYNHCHVEGQGAFPHILSPKVIQSFVGGAIGIWNNSNKEPHPSRERVWNTFNCYYSFPKKSEKIKTTPTLGQRLLMKKQMKKVNNVFWCTVNPTAIRSSCYVYPLSVTTTHCPLTFSHHPTMLTRHTTASKWPCTGWTRVECEPEAHPMSGLFEL